MPLAVSRWDDAVLQRRLWTPANLRGQAALKAWYDAGDLNTLSAVSGAVTALRDKSGFGLTLTAAGTVTPANLGLTVPLSGYNGLITTGMPVFYDMFVVGAPGAATFYRNLLWGAIDQNPFIMDNGVASIGIYDGAFKQAGSLTWPAGQFGIARLSMVSGTDISMSRDGGALAAVTSPNITSPTAQRLMNNNTPGNQGFGQVNEMIFTSARMGGGIPARIEGYLAWKWKYRGVGDLVKLLPALHPYKNRPPLIGA